MKKFFRFVIFIFIIALIGSYSYFYYFLNPKKSFRDNFFLLLRERISIANVYKNPFTPYSFKIKNIFSGNIYIENASYNYITKTLFLNNVIITDTFLKKIFALSKDFKYFNLPVNKIEFIHVNIVGNNRYTNNIHGLLSLKNNINFKLYGFRNNVFLKINGGFSQNGEVEANIKFPKAKAAEIAELLDFQLPSRFSQTLIQSGEIFLKGNINNIKKKKITFNVKDKKIEFSITKNIDTSIVSNGKIFLEDENTVDFSGEFLNKKNFSLMFKAENPVSGKIDNITFDNIKFAVNYSEEPDIDKINLKVEGDNIFLPNYQFAKKILQKNFSSDIKLSKLIIDNTTLENVNFNTTYTGKNLNINKLNFNMNRGKFIFSLIHQNETFQSALEIKHIDINKLFRVFLKHPTIGGILNVTFIGEGKDKIFNDTKGYFFVEDFYIKGISADNVTEQLKNDNLINLKLSCDDNATKTELLKFEMMKGFIKGENHYLNFPKIVTTDNSTYFNVYGKVDINNFNNIILNGIFSNDKYSKNIMVNINIENNLIQIVGKNE